jgi:PIN domain nuclease of toxin-antitoxin system
MDLLLDTHAAVWWAAGDPYLRPTRRPRLMIRRTLFGFRPPRHGNFQSRSEVGLALDVSKLVDQLTRNGIRLLGIGIDDAITAGSLDWTHKDPFDRMLVAQASRLGYRVVTRDVAIQKYLNSPNGDFVNA